MLQHAIEWRELLCAKIEVLTKEGGGKTFSFQKYHYSYKRKVIPLSVIRKPENTKRINISWWSNNKISILDIFVLFFFILIQSFRLYNSISIYFKRIWWIIDIFIYRPNTHRQCNFRAIGFCGGDGDASCCRELLLLLYYLLIYEPEILALFYFLGTVLHLKWQSMPHFIPSYRNPIMMPLGKHQYALDTRYLMNCCQTLNTMESFSFGYLMHIWWFTFLESYSRYWSTITKIKNNPNSFNRK